MHAVVAFAIALVALVGAVELDPALGLFALFAPAALRMRRRRGFEGMPDAPAPGDWAASRFNPRNWRRP